MGRRTINSFTTSTRPYKDNSDIHFILLSANHNYKMKTYGIRQLITVTERENLIQYQINVIKRTFPASRITVVLGYESDSILPFIPSHVSVVENSRHETTNEAESIRLGLLATPASAVCILNGELVFSNEFLKIPIEKSCIAYDDSKRIKDGDVGIRIVNEKATTFSYTIMETKFAHTAYLHGDELKIFRKLCKRSCEKMFFYEILQLLLNQVHELPVYKPAGIFSRIETSKDLKK